MSGKSEFPEYSKSFYLVIAFGFILILSTPNPNHSSVTYVQILQIFMLRSVDY